jgi:hypothetical protein
MTCWRVKRLSACGSKVLYLLCTWFFALRSKKPSTGRFGLTYKAVLACGSKVLSIFCCSVFRPAGRKTEQRAEASFSLKRAQN